MKRTFLLTATVLLFCGGAFAQTKEVLNSDSLSDELLGAGLTSEQVAYIGYSGLVMAANKVCGESYYSSDRLYKFIENGESLHEIPRKLIIKYAPEYSVITEHNLALSAAMTINFCKNVKEKLPEKD